MKNYLLIFLISVFIFLFFDFTLGNKILDFLHDKEIILSEEKRLLAIKKTRKEERKYRIKNEFYHHTLRPNIKIKSVWGSRKYNTCTDNNGFREQCDIKNGKEKNIILIGDSFVEGIGLDYGKTFAGMFSQEMNYRVYNMGVSSYSPVIYKNKIFHFIENGLNIKDVIVFIDISDIDDEANNYVECEKKVCSKNSFDDNSQQKVKKITKDFPIFDLIKLSIKRIKRTIKPKIYIYRKDFVRSNWTFIEETKNIKLGVKNSLYHMNELYKYLEKKDISLSVAVFPHPGQILHDKKNSKQVNLWKDFCIDKCKYFINYFPIFFDELENLKPKKLIKKYYIKNDIHYNHKGNIKLFEELRNLNFN